MNNMYEQLVRYDKTTKKIEPQLAESCTSADGGKTWTFKLRPGVKFHTGRAMDAAAAKAAIERTIKLNQGAAYEWGAGEVDLHAGQLDAGVQAQVRRRRWTASPPRPTAPTSTTPRPRRSSAPGSRAGHEAGTGPYELEKWNKGADVEVRLKRFPDYWKGWSGDHYAHVVFRHVPQATTSAQLLRSGDATIARQLNPQLFDSVKSAPGMTSETSPSFENLLGFLNTQSGPLKDKRVRQAVIDAFDYSGAIKALKGAGVAAHGFVPAGPGGL